MIIKYIKKIYDFLVSDFRNIIGALIILISMFISNYMFLYCNIKYLAIILCYLLGTILHILREDNKVSDDFSIIVSWSYVFFLIGTYLLYTLFI